MDRGKAIQYIIHHVFLPPQLPQSGDDKKTPLYDLKLREMLIWALRDVEPHLSVPQKQAINEVRDMVQYASQIRGSSHVVGEEDLLQVFRDLVKKGGSVPIPVVAQNGALILTKNGDAITFEALELSPPNSVIMGGHDRLTRCFPEPAVSVALRTFGEPGFQEMLAATLATMSHQPVAEMKPTARKAKQDHVEERDTAKPNMVTEFLMTVLLAMGDTADVPKIWKNTRDEVLWSDALLPWRRSPGWLLIRVAMQLMLTRREAPHLYKAVMVRFMSHILDSAVSLGIQSDILHCMISKLSRRLRKINKDHRPAWLSTAETSIEVALECIRQRREVLSKTLDPPIDLSSIRSLDFRKDVPALFPALDALLEHFRSKMPAKADGLDFVPPALPVMHDDSCLPTQATLNLSVGSASAILNLASIEEWVASQLDNWLEKNYLESDSCWQLLQLNLSYYRMSSSHYYGNPENISIMVLTCLELWVACDKSATAINPLLLDYETEVPSQLLSSLILPFREQMERLSVVERYLENRKRQARRYPSVFTGFGTPNCLSIRYFADSVKHQVLMERINQDATQKRREKIAELQQKKNMYSSYMNQYWRSVCDYETRTLNNRGDTETVHSYSCQRCRWKALAEQLTILLHEWPLPSGILEAQSTVFELDVPLPLGAWRDATMFLVLEVLHCAYNVEEKPQNLYQPSQCLGQYQSNSYNRRLDLASTTKPHAVTHRNGISVSIASEGSVCVNNAMRYRYLDSHRGCFVEAFVRTDELAKMCTYQLPAISSPLQKFLFRPPDQPSGPPPNEVISSQSECPENISLDEFKALAAIPLGYRTQWQNILVQLFAPSADLKKIETSLVILQTSRQAGPPSADAARASHQVLYDPDFANQFLRGLRESLTKIKDNWQSCKALGSFVLLATRLLSINQSHCIAQACLDYLARCRGVAMEWARGLLEKAQDASEDDQRFGFLLRTSEICLICMSTYDVDTHHLVGILSETSQASLLVEAAIMAQETATHAARSSDAFRRICSQRWQRLMHKAYPTLLAEFVDEGNKGLDLAISRTWSAYHPSAGWTPVSSESQYWLVTHSAATTTAARPLVVHFNLLTAELLVNGLPLSRLPASYEDHPRYGDLFGQAAVYVMPASEEGMDFSAKKKHHGHAVYFGMRQSPGCSSPDLMVRAVKEGTCYDLLPSRVLENQLPTHFVRDYVHWYCRSSETIESSPDALGLVRGKMDFG